MIRHPRIASLLITATVVSILTSGGCAPVYIPPATHTDLFTGEGEFHAGGYIGSNGYDGQIAYAVTNHVSVAGAFSYNDNAPSKYSYEQHAYGEFALGWFTHDAGLHFEALAGIGRGTAKSGDLPLQFNFFGPVTDTAYLLSAHGDYNRYYVQGNIGTSGRIFKGGWNLRGEFGTATRLALVDFYRLTRNDVLHRHVQNWFGEMVLFARVGGDLLNFELQFGFSDSFHKDPPFDYDPWIGSAGVQLTLGR